jgi:hypothetical protein
VSACVGSGEYRLVVVISFESLLVELKEGIRDRHAVSVNPSSRPRRGEKRAHPLGHWIASSTAKAGDPAADFRYVPVGHPPSDVLLGLIGCRRKDALHNSGRDRVKYRVVRRQGRASVRRISGAATPGGRRSEKVRGGKQLVWLDSIRRHELLREDARLTALALGNQREGDRRKAELGRSLSQRLT